jgi:hypothetical protein
MTIRWRRIVLVVLAVAAAAIGAAALRTPGGSPTAPTGPEPAGGPAAHTDPDFWTKERMRGARPAPMPAPPEGP